MCRLIVSDIITALCPQARVDRIGQFLDQLKCEKPQKMKYFLFREMDSSCRHMPMSS